MTPGEDLPSLIARSREGDRAAFSTLVERFQDVVYNLILQRLGDPDLALDAAQETFVNAFAGLPGFRGESSFKSWLLAIAIREAENQRRRKARQLPAVALSPSAEPADRGTGPDHDLEHQDDVALVRRALREADEEDARLILLRDVENLSYLEIAEALGIALGTVKSGLNRARARLRAAIEKARPPRSRERVAPPAQVR